MERAKRKRATEQNTLRYVGVRCWNIPCPGYPVPGIYYIDGRACIVALDLTFTSREGERKKKCEENRTDEQKKQEEQRKKSNLNSLRYVLRYVGVFRVRVPGT